MLSVICYLAAHFVLLLAPLLVGAWIAAHRSDDPAALVAGGFIGVGVAGFASGIVWYLDPHVGVWVSRAVPVVCVLLLIGAALVDRPAFLRLSGLLVPVGMMLGYAAFILGLGLLYGSVDRAPDMAEVRFSWQLPIDNLLPYFVADHVAQFGHSTPIPAIGDWLSSDRPPLQSAVVLAHTVTAPAGGVGVLHYQVISTVLQCLWVPAVWALLHAIGARGVTVALSLCAVGTAGLVIMNSFYGWPKMLAAAYVLSCAALILRRRSAHPSSAFAAAAALAGFAYLAHGGAVFVLVPLVVVAVAKVLRLAHPWRIVLGAAGSAALVVAPWVWYQKVMDPPGDRLFKWMLADVRDVDPRPVLQTILEAYQNAGPAEIVINKLANFRTLLVNPLPRYLIEQITVPDADLRLSFVQVSRQEIFFSVLPSLGLLLVLAVGWLRPRSADPADRRASQLLLALAAAGAVFWCLVMFGPATTVNHQGTYALPVLLMCALTCAGASHSGRGTAAVIGCAAVITAVVLVPFVPIADTQWQDTRTVQVPALLVLIAGLAGYLGIACWYGRTAGRSAADPAGPPEAAAAGPPVPGPMPSRPTGWAALSGQHSAHDR